MTGKLYFAIGLPRSGKSTLAKKWVNYQIDIEPEGKIVKRYKPGETHYFKQVGHMERPRVIVCADSIRLALHGQRYLHSAEPYVAAIKDTMIKSLLVEHDVFVDGTHTRAISIKECLYIQKSAVPIYIDTDEDTCIERAIATDQDDLILPIERMHDQLGGLLEMAPNRVWTDYTDTEWLARDIYRIVDLLRDEI